MQGSTPGPLKCSNSIDSLGKKCMKKGQNLYNYKGVDVPLLGCVDDIIGAAECGKNSIDLNIFITTQIELKKLRFHVPDSEGKTKCHKIHVGKESETCPELLVHGTVMQSVQSDKYLGDVISGDGKNTLNIESRVSKGLGIVTQIQNLLDTVSLGHHYFDIALLLRESMLVNGILTNAQIWYGLKENELKALENIDKIYLRSILKTKSSLAYEAYFLELGIIPLSLIIKGRRVKYLHYLVNRPENEMISKFLKAQWNNPVKNDWTTQVRQDLKDLNISENFDIFKKYKKNAFKKIVNQKLKEYTFKYLIKMKEGHSKMKNIKYESLKMQKYFSDSQLNINNKRDIFAFRTRMAEFGENYRGQRSYVICPYLCYQKDSQAHSFQCTGVTDKIEVNGQYSDIFKNDIPVQTIHTLTKIRKLRQNFLEDENISVFSNSKQGQKRKLES